MNLFKFHEFDIPVDLVNITGGGVDTFEAISQAHIINLQKFIGIDANDSFLEIGCGIGRDAIPLTKILSPQGSYLGVDIIRPSIDFCEQNITPLYPNFKFIHFDVRDQLHNPSGLRSMGEYTLPLDDHAIDKIIVWSVFTHMFDADIRHYLKEFKRVLKPDGAIYATCFVITDPVLQRARETNLTIFDLRFMHKVDSDCYINDTTFPLGAIGYSPERWADMVNSSGLHFKRDFIKGGWSGYHAEPEDGQDALVLV